MRALDIFQQCRISRVRERERELLEKTGYRERLIWVTIFCQNLGSDRFTVDILIGRQKLNKWLSGESLSQYDFYKGGTEIVLQIFFW